MNYAAIFGSILVAILVVYLLVSMIKVVKEKEVMIIERFGKYSRTLTAGVHFLIPIIERPKKFSYRYYITNPRGQIELVQKNNLTRVSIQAEVQDFPSQKVVTKDNCFVVLDTVLSYKIINPKQMIYSVRNLPNVLSKLLQAQLRNVAGSLEVDQIIEEAASLNVLTGLMESECARWGVRILFVKVQRVEAPGLEQVLAAKKNADLNNKEVVIGAKSYKQSKLIEAEGKRDSMIKKAEGEKLQVISTAKGMARAVINNAEAEARSIKEITRGVAHEEGNDPIRYLLSLKYLDALHEISNKSGSSVIMTPQSTSVLQTAQDFGLNTIFPTHPVVQQQQQGGGAR